MPADNYLLLRWSKRKENGRRPKGVPRPSLPIIGKMDPEGPDWLHEIKHDGYRLMVRRVGDDVLIITRGGHDWTIRHPAIAAAARRLPGKLLIDGEGVVSTFAGEDKHRWSIYINDKAQPAGGARHPRYDFRFSS